MNYKNLMLISALGLITFSSCKKDDKVINLTSMPIDKKGMVNTLRVSKI